MTHLFVLVHIRGGVEDTRLEAKDTKKIRGHGQGQPLSRQSTGMLQAKAKNYGHKRQVFSKKRLKKFFFNFSGDLKKKVFKKIFQAMYKILTIQKIMRSSSEDRAIFEDLGFKAKAKDSTSGAHNDKVNTSNINILPRRGGGNNSTVF